jgi:hypothetical protein
MMGLMISLISSLFDVVGLFCVVFLLLSVESFRQGNVAFVGIGTVLESFW